MAKLLKFLVSLFICTFLLSSCLKNQNDIAQMATDIPQMALYAAVFNTSQDKYKVNVHYYNNLASKLRTMEDKSSFVVGKNLLDSRLHGCFVDISRLYKKIAGDQTFFYPALLENGKIADKYYILPVSFNLPIVIFDKEQESKMTNGFVLEISELEKLGAEYNQTVKNSFSKIGFDPRWSSSSLYSVIKLFGADFHEDTKLSWNQDNLTKGIEFLRRWSEEANGSIAKSNEFQFKYLYLPSYQSILNNRIAFASIDSSDFFTISEERRSNLSFRFLSKDNQVLVNDDVVYAAICNKSSGRKASEAFLKWFYSEKTQKDILDESSLYRTMESSFGIAGGFSAVCTINERVFPQYYPLLLGRFPPANYLVSPNILPTRWPEIKKDVLIPFLVEATGENPPENLDTLLNERINSWYKLHESE